MSGASYDIVIAGSGFSGSLMALMLHQSGFSVMVVEGGKHPRFAIGESSTPIADMVLRSLAEEYNLPWLNPLSRYGSWQEHYPEIGCGIKRGFSYFFHQPGRPFLDSEAHENALLVAASTSDRDSDTQWYRADVDAFLVGKVREYGIEYVDETRIRNCRRHAGRWNIALSGKHGDSVVKAGFLIDATGSPDFASKYLGAHVMTHGFETHSRAIFSHFDGVGRWQDQLAGNEMPVSDFPYNPDHSALHQVLEEGWMWMLRFNRDRLSAGLVIDGFDERAVTAMNFKSIVSRYPSLQSQFEKSRLSPVPGKVIKTGWLQSKLETGYGDGWFALGHSAGFIDPLHSTGIAHSLTGLERVAGILKKEGLNGMEQQSPRLHDIFSRELTLIDRLVAACYHSRSHPDLFHAVVMVYFACSVNFEQKRLKGDAPEYYLCANNNDLFELAGWICRQTRDWKQQGSKPEAAERLISEIKAGITPYNTVGLMDPTKNRMYHHTAVNLD